MVVAVEQPELLVDSKQVTISTLNKKKFVITLCIPSNVCPLRTASRALLPNLKELLSHSPQLLLPVQNFLHHDHSPPSKKSRTAQAHEKTCTVRCFRA
jgi:hypothetical protein